MLYFPITNILGDFQLFINNIQLFYVHDKVTQLFTKYKLNIKDQVRIFTFESTNRV